MPFVSAAVVGAGDAIEKVGEAKERMTVAEINALLYSHNHPRGPPLRDFGHSW